LNGRPIGQLEKYRHRFVHYAYIGNGNSAMLLGQFRTFNAAVEAVVGEFKNPTKRPALVTVGHNRKLMNDPHQFGAELSAETMVINTGQESEVALVILTTSGRAVYITPEQWEQFRNKVDFMVRERVLEHMKSNVGKPKPPVSVR
jgi:hypothetical protein